MNKKKLSMLGVIVVTLMVLVLMPILGCAPKAQPAAKPDKVVLYHFGDLSGPYAPITSPLVAGFDDAIAWYAEKYGGIDGVPLTQTFRDSGGKLDAALAAYAAFKESTPYPYILFVYQSNETEALHDRFIEDKILCLSASSSPMSVYPSGYTLAFLPGYTDLIGGFIDWLVDDWAKKTGVKPKLALLGWDSPFHRAVMVPEVRDYAKKRGVEIVNEGVYGVRDLDVTTQMTAIKAAGANWVYGNTTGYGVKVRALAAQSLGILTKDPFDVTPGKVHMAGGPWDTDESSAMVAGDLMEGYVGVRVFVSPWETENEGVKIFNAMADKKGRKPAERIGGYIASWSLVAASYDTIGNVVKKVGWDKLNGETLRAEWFKMKGYEPLKLTKWTYTADKPESIYYRVHQCQGGKVLPITDWRIAPDLRPYSVKK